MSGVALAGTDSQQKPEVVRAEKVIKCVVIEKKNFCTELGFVDRVPGSGSWKTYLSSALAQASSDTGDMALSQLVTRLEALPPAELAARQKEQIAEAKLGVGKVLLGDYLMNGEPIPDGFFAAHQGLRIDESSVKASNLRLAATGHGSLEVSGGTATPGQLGTGRMVVTGIPNFRTIMAGYSVTQDKNYYCGPATMAAIDWADDGTLDSQAGYWATDAKLKTTSQGATAIADMVRLINSDTDWDVKAGTYVVESVSSKNLAWFRNIHTTNIGVQAAPVLEHPKLVRGDGTSYFTHIRWDHGGHYQTGRGYDLGADVVYFLEPYNEATWLTGGYASGGYQSVSFTRMWNATRANSLQNVGW